MSRVDKIVSWFFLLCKRTLKRTSFVVILCMIPLLAFGVNRMAKEDGGMLSIAVAIEPDADATAKNLADTLLHQSSVIYYKEADSEAEARALVEAGEVDAAWLIPGNLQKKIEKFVEEGMDEDYYLLQIIEKEDNVALHLTREILFGKLYEPLAYEIYSQYLQTELLPESGMTEAELKDAYYRWDVEENFFQFSYLNGEAQEVGTEYLLLPMRGLLAIFVLLSGLAFSMYHMREEEQGCLVWTGMESSVIRCWCYHLPELFLVNLAVLPALYFTGVFESPGKEILLLGLYSVMTIGFCDVLRRICKKISVFGVILPIVILLSLVLSPTFLRVDGLMFLKSLLPITYYFSALHESNKIIGMVLFIVIVYILDCILLFGEKNKRFLRRN